MKNRLFTLLLSIAVMAPTSGEAKTVAHHKPAIKAAARRTAAVAAVPLIAMDAPMVGARSIVTTVTTLFFPSSGLCSSDPTSGEVYETVATTGPYNQWSVTYCDGSPQYLTGTNVQDFQKAVAAGRREIEYENKRVRLPPFVIGKTYTVHTDEELERFPNDHLGELVATGAKYRMNFLNAAHPHSTTKSVVEGAPSADEILRASDKINAELRGIGLTGTPGVHILYSTLGGEIGREYRTISHLNCSKLRVGAYRCSYDFMTHSEATDPSSLLGSVAALSYSMQGVQTYPLTYTFTVENGAWTSDEIRTAILADQQRDRNDDAARQRDKWDDDERERKFNECTSQARVIPCGY